MTQMKRNQKERGEEILWAPEINAISIIISLTINLPMEPSIFSGMNPCRLLSVTMMGK